MCLYIVPYKRGAPEDRRFKCTIFYSESWRGLVYIFIFTLFEPTFTMAISPRCKLVEMEA